MSLIKIYTTGSYVSILMNECSESYKHEENPNVQVGLSEEEQITYKSVP